MVKKIFLALGVCVVAAAVWWFWLMPRYVHSVTICGQVLKNGHPIATGSAEIFAMLGGDRYVLDNGSLKAFNQEDRTRFKKEIVLKSDGTFCTEQLGLKYFYKNSGFKVFALQISRVSAKPLESTEIADPYSKFPPPLSPDNATDGSVIARKLEREEQHLNLKVLFKL